MPHPTLTQFETHHIPTIQKLASLEVNTRLTHVPHPYPKDGAAFYQNQCKKNWQSGESHEFVVLLENEIIGMCGVLHLKTSRPMMGYWIDHHFWGQGIGTKIVEQLLHHCQYQLNLLSVFAPVLTENLASIRVLKKNGFHLETTQTISDQDPKFSGREILIYQTALPQKP